METLRRWGNKDPKLVICLKFEISSYYVEQCYILVWLFPVFYIFATWRNISISFLLDSYFSGIFLHILELILWDESCGSSKTLLLDFVSCSRGDKRSETLTERRYWFMLCSRELQQGGLAGGSLTLDWLKESWFVSTL